MDRRLTIEQIERITRMECALEQAMDAVTVLSAALEIYLAAVPSLQELAQYHSSAL